VASGSVRPNTQITKRSLDEDIDIREKKRRLDENVVEDELVLEQINIIEESISGTDLMKVFDSYRGIWESETYFYDPYEWEVSVFEDMCAPEKFGDIDYDQVYYDETTWEELDPAHVAGRRSRRDEKVQ